jgi:hypothetical protein
VRGEDDVEAERLGGLNPDKSVARHHVPQPASGLSERIYYREGRHGALSRVQRRYQPLDDVSGKEGAGGIVDEHGLGAAFRRDRFQALAHAVLPLGTTFDGRT